MRKIVLMCAAGMSTSMLVKKMQEAAKAINYECSIAAYPTSEATKEGSDADIVVFDPEKENVISAKTHLYNTDNNPYEGFKLHGDVDSVYLRGAHVVQNGKVLVEKAGKYIKRGKKLL